VELGVKASRSPSVDADLDLVGHGAAAKPSSWKAAIAALP